MEKWKVREQVKERIRGLNAKECIEADRKICSCVMDMEEYQRAQAVFSFVGTKGEINTVPILEDVLKQGKRLGVPRCTGKGQMEVYEIRSLSDLEPGSYGILEPNKGCKRMEPQEIALAILPCLACTRDGNRLGHGGGYYDRYLERMEKSQGKKACTVLLSREAFILDELPQEAHDRRAEAVVSEKGIWRRGKNLL